MRSRTPIARFSVVAAISLLISACGGGSGSRHATDPTDPSVLAYSQCMRSHGVPDFPDPDQSGGIPKDKIIALGDGPQLQAAENACLQMMPAEGLGPTNSAQQTPASRTAALAFAKCMRNHGLPTFPDPTPKGELTREMVGAAGIDLHQPALLQAGLACASVTHGLITRAAVERAVNGS